MIYSFIVFGLVAGYMTNGAGRAICVLYCFGLAGELAVSELYDSFGLLPAWWGNYYLSIALIDLITLLMMSWSYNRKYLLVYQVMFIMVIVNAIIPPEWALFGTTYIQSNSGDSLLALNIIVLLVLLVNSNGHRILDRFTNKLRGGHMEGGIWRADHMVCLYDPEDCSQARKVKSCSKA